MKLGTRVTGRRAGIEIDGRGVGDEIRSKAVNETVSFFAAIPELREALLDYQRGQADEARRQGFRGLVMEGRDIGSVIFPDADFRFFLQADPAERARRRVAEGTAGRDPRTRPDRLLAQDGAAHVPAGGHCRSTAPICTLEEVVARIAAHDRRPPRPPMNPDFPQLRMEFAYGFFHFADDDALRDPFPDRGERR